MDARLRWAGAHNNILGCYYLLKYQSYYPWLWTSYSMLVPIPIGTQWLIIGCYAILCAAFRLDNFVVGLTNDDPATTPPVYKSSYTVCGPHTRCVASIAARWLPVTTRLFSAQRCFRNFVTSLFKCPSHGQKRFASMKFSSSPEVSSDKVHISTAETIALWERKPPPTLKFHGNSFSLGRLTSWFDLETRRKIIEDDAIGQDTHDVLLVLLHYITLHFLTWPK